MKRFFLAILQMAAVGRPWRGRAPARPCLAVTNTEAERSDLNGNKRRRKAPSTPHQTIRYIRAQTVARVAG